MNRLIDDLPSVQAVREERAQVEAEWQRWLEWKNDKIAKRDQAEIEYKAALRRAVEAGDDPPRAPELLDLQDEHNRRLVNRQAADQRLDRAHQRAISKAAREIHTAARAEMAAAVEDAAPHVAALEQILVRARAAQQAVRQVLVAQDLVRGVRTLTSTGPEPADLGALAEAVKYGRDLLHVRQNGGILVDRGEDDGKHAPRPSGRRAGFVSSNLRDVPDRSDWEPRDGSWQQVP